MKSSPLLGPFGDTEFWESSLLKIGWEILCFKLASKLQSIVSFALIHTTFSAVDISLNFETSNLPNYLYVFSTEKIPRILNHQMVQGGGFGLTKYGLKQKIGCPKLEK